MCKAKEEIYNQYRSLKRTLELMRRRSGELRELCGRTEGFTFFGCGSSYSLAKGAAKAAGIYGAGRTDAVAAGDYIINHEHYSKALERTCVVLISRSGQTSEMVIAAQLIRQAHPELPIISLCATESSPLCEYATLSLEMPWAFDESTCQTQTVSNLYAASLLLLATCYGDGELFDEFGALVETGDDYLRRVTEEVRPLCSKGWSFVVVLADGLLCGAAEEGALAFNEICMKHSHYYNVLDVRHGPMVLVGPGTLVVMHCSSSESEKQNALIADLRKRGAYVVAASRDGSFTSADMSLVIPSKTDGGSGLCFLNIIQLIALGCALEEGVDPDNPVGLDPWIKL